MPSAGLSMRSELPGSRAQPPVVGVTVMRGSYVIEQIRIDILAGPYIDDPKVPNVVTGNLPYLQRLTDANVLGDQDRTFSLRFVGVDPSGTAVPPGAYNVSLVLLARSTDSTCTTNGGRSLYHSRLCVIRWTG